MPDPFVAQLGRISGHMLAPDLIRDGIDLTFRNRALDEDLLFLNVSDKIIGVNKDSPAFDLDVNALIRTIDVDATAATIGDLTFFAPSTVSTLNGLPINISPSGNDPTVVFNIMGTEEILFDENNIFSLDNNDIVFDPAGTGIVDIQSSAIVKDNLTVVGDIFIDGTLSTTGDIILGDEPMDVVIINTDLSQDIEPKFDLTYNIGSEEKRWTAAYIKDWQYIENIRPFSANINESMLLGGTENAIKALQPDQDLLLSPSTGIYYIERLRIEENSILNLDNTPLTLAATGNGYYKFAGTNALLIPEGTSAERPGQETGDVRLNTELGYLEVFDGTVYVIAIGPGDPVTTEEMQDFGNLYSLILG
jgi:hypothetical protein